MRITKEKAAENRASLIKAAARLFREHGIDGVGVADISKAAKLTHGALYAHFPSKEALAAEALAYGTKDGNEYLKSLDKDDDPDLGKYLEYYLSPRHRDNLAVSCSMAASASEIGRQDEAVSASFSEGFNDMVELVEASLGDSAVQATAHERALAIVAAMIGGVAVARATAKSRPKLSEQVLRATRAILAEIGGMEPRTSSSRTVRKVKKAA
jgi:TetR/AcrR family transcriptional regulator, transcriptional repressor for nem operon